MELFDKLLVTIQALYDAVLDESSWGEALTRAEELLGGNATFLYSVNTSTGALISARINHVPDECLTEYAEHQVYEDCRNEFIIRNPTPEIQYDFMHIDERAMRRSGHYEWLAKYDWSYYIGGRVYEKDTTQVYYGVQRSKAAGHVDEKTIGLYRALYPHLHRAVKLTMAMRNAHVSSIAREHAIDSSTAGVLLLDGSRNLLYANSAAQEISCSGGGLSISTTKGLRAVDHRDNERLQAVIRSVLAPDRPDNSGGAKSIAITKRNSVRSYWVSVVPVSHRVTPEFLADRPQVVVMIIDPDRVVCHPIGQLRQTFGLTTREAELLHYLAQGVELEGAASAMKISVATARTHLKGVFRKTGTHRQAELLALLGNLRAIKTGDPD